MPADAVTMTRAPMALAIWMAAVPTPEPPACTRAVPPDANPPCATRASKAVIHASGMAAPSATPTGEGTAMSWRSCTAIFSA